MGQQHLNRIMSLHAHKDRTDSLSLIDITNDFVANRAEHRNSSFRKFSVLYAYMYISMLLCIY